MKPRSAFTVGLTFALTFFLLIPVLAKPRKMQRLQSGTWGGDQIAVEVGTASATINYPCAHGTINGPLSIDSKGRFTLRGTHVHERGGPIRLNQPLAGVPARYTGWTDGKKLNLTVTLTDTNEVVGTFTLERGRYSRIRKCG